jgi:hypothetical protein
MLSKNQIAAELEERGLGRRRQIANILDGLASLAAEEIASGQDFTVPGIVKVGWAYTSPLAKGEKHRKGETYVGFGGQEITAEADSKPRKASSRDGRASDGLRSSSTGRSQGDVADSTCRSPSR